MPLQEECTLIQKGKKTCKLLQLVLNFNITAL